MHSDFLWRYGHESVAQKFNCVATSYVVDAVPNIVEMVSAVKRALVPRGVWVNCGPLQYHTASYKGVRLTWEEVMPGSVRSRNVLPHFRRIHHLHCLATVTLNCLFAEMQLLTVTVTSFQQVLLLVCSAGFSLLEHRLSDGTTSHPYSECFDAMTTQVYREGFFAARLQ